MECLEERLEKWGKVGRYRNVAEPFHCDVNHNLFLGHLGNHLLNAADYQSSERGFGMDYLNTQNKTWVLSRLAIEMQQMPRIYDEFYIETWVESAMRYFTNRNFRLERKGQTIGYARSVWALIDLKTRQPENLFQIRDGEITAWTDAEKACPIGKPGRVKMSREATLEGEYKMRYNDVDVNGHVNSVKYIEHVLDQFPIALYQDSFVQRFEIAYVAESYYGDTLRFYKEQTGDREFAVRISKVTPETEVECCRSLLRFGN